MAWYLYILDCDGRLYTGISTDPERRVSEHRSRGRRAARFTRVARRHELIYAVAVGTRSDALRAEARVKKLRREKKAALVHLCPGREALLRFLGLQDLGE